MMNADLTAFYNLPDEERESIERQLNYIVWVYYAGDPAQVGYFAAYAYALNTPLTFAIAEIVLDMIAQED
jgi:hypothetical protein